MKARVTVTIDKDLQQVRSARGKRSRSQVIEQAYGLRPRRRSRRDHCVLQSLGPRGPKREWASSRGRRCRLSKEDA